MAEKSVPAHLRLQDQQTSNEKALPPTPRSSRAPEHYSHSSLEVYNLNGLEHHRVSPSLPEVLSCCECGKELRVLPEDNDSQGRKLQEEKTVLFEHERSKSPRKKLLQIWLALSVLVISTLALGVGLGVGLKHRSRLVRMNSSLLRRARVDMITTPSTSTRSSAVPLLATSTLAGASFNDSSPLTKSSATPASWRSKSIYQVLTDRFARTDKSATSPCDVGSRSYCGGTWQGIIQQLDYIQNMGFTAIWISPVTMQLSQNTSEGEAYHGYWQQNIYELNPKFGNASDLRALSIAVHSRNMYLMVDVVINHLGWPGDERTFNTTSLSPFNDTSYFHSYCPITDYDYVSNQSAVEDCWLGNRQVVEPLTSRVTVNVQISNVALPDLDTTNSFVIDTYYSWVKQLVSHFAIDGLRIDSVKHVQKGFWPGFNSAAGVFCMGEVFDSDPSYTCPYQDVLDGVLNYPLFYSLTAAFHNSSGDMDALVSKLSSIRSSCKDSTLLSSFIENHDNPRFPSLTRDTALAKNVIAFTILADGIPIVYQGQEQSYSGGNDPYNREAIWTADYSTKASLYGYIGSVNQIRNQEIYKTPNYVTDPSSTIYSDKNNIAIRKGAIVSIYTNNGAGSTDYNLTLSDTGYTANSTIVELIGCDKVTVDATGNITVAMSGGIPRVFSPLSHLLSSGICYL